MQWFKNPRFLAHCPGFLYAEAKDSWSRRLMCKLRWLIYRLEISTSVKTRIAVRYGTPQFLLRSTVRWYNNMPFLEWYGYGTLQKLNWSRPTVRCYGTVQVARYVVRKFWTYCTVPPFLVTLHFKQKKDLCKYMEFRSQKWGGEEVGE